MDNQDLSVLLCFHCIIKKTISCWLCASKLAWLWVQRAPGHFITINITIIRAAAKLYSLAVFFLLRLKVFNQFPVTTKKDSFQLPKCNTIHLAKLLHTVNYHLKEVAAYSAAPCPTLAELANLYPLCTLSAIFSKTNSGKHNNGGKLWYPCWAKVIAHREGATCLWKSICIGS